MQLPFFREATGPHVGNIYKDGKLLKSRARPRINTIDFDSLKSRLDRARKNKNDLLEAEDFLMIAMVVSCDNRHPTRDEPLPIGHGFLTGSGQTQMPVSDERSKISYRIFFLLLPFPWTIKESIKFAAGAV